MKIMVSTDGSDLACKALEIAAKLARASACDLHILHVVESDVSRAEIAYDGYGEKGRRAKVILREAQEIIKKVSPDVQVTARMAVGPISTEIIRIAEESGMNALFIGAGGTSMLKRMLVGSVADDVLRYAHCPVTVVRYLPEFNGAAGKRFLICTDGSEHGDKAVKAGAIAAKQFGFEVTILNVIRDVIRYEELPDTPGFKIRIERARNILENARRIVGGIGREIVCREQIGNGPVASEIVRAAAAGDYNGLFVGSRGNTMIKRMLVGSVADDVIRHAPCPVTVVR